MSKTSAKKKSKPKSRPQSQVTPAQAQPTLARQAADALAMAEAAPERLAGQPDRLLALQQLAGNRATQSVIDAGRNGVRDLPPLARPVQARATNGVQREDGPAATAAVGDKAKSLKEKLSYGLFDWVITDKEAREVMAELNAAGESELNALLAAMGQKYVNRLLDNLNRKDIQRYDLTALQIIKFKNGANSTGYLKDLVAYDLVVTAIAWGQHAQLVEALNAAPAADFRKIILKIDHNAWMTLLRAGDQDQLSAILDKFARVRNVLDPTALTADGRIIGAAQVTRAAAKYRALKAVDKDAFQQLLEKATLEKEQRYLFKALAAGYSLGDITSFAAKIRGKGEAWMQNNLHLTEDTGGKGIKQQWSHTCNITTVQAVQGEMDPIFALKLHEENPDLGKVDEADATKVNPKLAASQKAGLESGYSGTKFGAHSGVAAPRATPKAGGGRWADDKLNAISGVTGVKYATKLVGTDITLSAALKAISKGSDSGMPVPIVIGNGPGQYTHYVLVTRKVSAKPLTYKIHDPWAGTTYTRSYKVLKEGKINIAGSNQITAIEDPSAAP